jgi:sulfur carrier protein
VTGSRWRVAGAEPQLNGSDRISAVPHPPLALPAMKVILRNPRRELDLEGVNTVSALLARLGVVAESVLVICNDELVTRDARLRASDVVEIRPVVSGGAR